MSFERRPGVGTRVDAEMADVQPAANVGKRSLVEVEPALAVQADQVDPRQLAREMMNERFLLARTDGGLREGATVVVKDWRPERDDVLVFEDGDAKETKTVVKKANLVAKQPNVAGIAPYLANPAIEKSDNDRLVRETQYNRFDPIIKREVDAANTRHGYAADPLDPNLVKAMLFEESRMGTSGMHLRDDGSGVKTRFNVGQVIDSHAAALLPIMKAEYPAIYAKYQLADLEAAFGKPRYGMSAEDYAQFVAQKPDGVGLGEYFIRTWSRDVPPLQRPSVVSQFELARKELFASPDPAKEPDRNNSYEFWIHVMVEWLFEKRRSTKTWEDAVRAYNGSGAAAENYKTRVTARRDGAVKAGQTGAAVMPFEKDGGTQQKPLGQPSLVDVKPPPSPRVSVPGPAPEGPVELAQVPYVRIGRAMRIERLDIIHYTGVVVPMTAAAFVICDANGDVLDRHTTQPARINGVIHHEPEEQQFTMAAGQYFVFAAYWGIDPEGAMAGKPRKLENQLLGRLDVLAGDTEWRRRDG